MDQPGYHEEECTKRRLAILVMSATILGATLPRAAEPLKAPGVSAIPDENPNEQNGIKPENDFSKSSFSGAHDAALWVESGKVVPGP